MQKQEKNREKVRKSRGKQEKSWEKHGKAKVGKSRAAERQ